MRRLMPLPGGDGVDLDEAYWLSDVGHQQVRGVMVASADGAAQAQGRAGAFGTGRHSTVRGPAGPSGRAPRRSHHRPGRGLRRGAARSRSEGLATGTGALRGTAHRGRHQDVRS